MEKSQDAAPLRLTQRARAANELVIGHAAVRKRDSTPRFDANASPQGQAWPQHQGVQEIALETYVIGYRAIVERARQRRDEIDLPGGSALQKTAPWDLDDDFQLGRLR